MCTARVRTRIGRVELCFDCRGEALGVSHGHQPAKAVTVEHLSGAKGTVGRDDGGAGLEGLDQGPREAFVAGRQSKYASSACVGLGVVHEAGKEYAPRQAQLFGLGFQRGALGALPQNDQVQVPSRGQVGKCAQQHREVLLWREPPNPKNDWLCKQRFVLRCDLAASVPRAPRIGNRQDLLGRHIEELGGFIGHTLRDTHDACGTPVRAPLRTESEPAPEPPLRRPIAAQGDAQIDDDRHVGHEERADARREVRRVYERHRAARPNALEITHPGWRCEDLGDRPEVDLGHARQRLVAKWAVGAGDH